MSKRDDSYAEEHQDWYASWYDSLSDEGKRESDRTRLAIAKWYARLSDDDKKLIDVLDARIALHSDSFREGGMARDKRYYDAAEAMRDERVALTARRLVREEGWENYIDAAFEAQRRHRRRRRQ